MGTARDACHDRKPTKDHAMSIPRASTGFLELKECPSFVDKAVNAGKNSLTFPVYFMGIFLHEYTFKSLPGGKN